MPTTVVLQHSGFSRPASSDVYIQYSATMHNNATETNRAVPLNYAAKISKFYVRITANATTGGSNTFTSRNGGVAGNMTISVPTGTTGEFEDTTNVDVVPAGNLICWRVQIGTGGAVVVGCTSVLLATEQQQTVSMFGGGAGSVDFSAADTTNFPSLSGLRGGNTTEADGQCYIDTYGSLKYSYGVVQSNGRSTATTLTSRINGVNGTITISVGAGLTGAFSDSVHSDAVKPGDKVCWNHTTGSGSGTISWLIFNISLETMDGSFLILMGGQQGNSTGYPASTNIFFNGFTPENTLETTEANTQIKQRLDSQFRSMAAYISGNAAAGATTVRSRVNGINGRQALSIGAAATGTFLSTSVDRLSINDQFCGNIIVGSGGAVTFRTISMLFQRTVTPINVGHRPYPYRPGVPR